MQNEALTGTFADLTLSIAEGMGHVWEGNVSSRRVAGLVAAGLIVAASLAAAPVAAKGHLDVLLDGLSSPKGITAAGNALFIGQGWAGAPGPVLQYQLSGRGKGTVAGRSPIR